MADPVCCQLSKPNNAICSTDNVALYSWVFSVRCNPNPNEAGCNGTGRVNNCYCKHIPLCTKQCSVANVKRTNTAVTLLFNRVTSLSVITQWSDVMTVQYYSVSIKTNIQREIVEAMLHNPYYWLKKHNSE